MTNLEEQLVWTIRPTAFRLWSESHTTAFGPGFDREPTAKSLVFLALLEQVGEQGPTSYQTIEEIIALHNVVEGKIPRPSLRVAISELGRSLDKLGHRFQLEATRQGRESAFYLRERPVSVASH